MEKKKELTQELYYKISSKYDLYNILSIDYK